MSAVRAATGAAPATSTGSLPGGGEAQGWQQLLSCVCVCPALAYPQAELSPMAATFGGLVGQEVVKAASGKFHPLFQVGGWVGRRAGGRPGRQVGGRTRAD